MTSEGDEGTENSGLFFVFVWGFSSHSRIFHLYGNVTINGERLQILIYARHSRPLSSERLAVQLPLPVFTT